VDLIENASMRNIAEVDGFAVRPLGQYSLVLSLRELGEGDDAWRDIATYPIRVGNIYPPQ